MRIIIEVFGRAWMFEAHSAKIISGDDCEEDSHESIHLGGPIIERAADEDGAEEAEEPRKFGFG